MKCLRWIAWCLLAGCLPAQGFPPGYRLEPVAQGLQLAAAMAFMPDGRLLVAERVTGAVRVVAGPGSPRTFANVPSQGAPSSEVGLLGIVVDPAFQRNGHVYVHYTRSAPGFEAVLGRLTDVGGSGQGLIELGRPMPVAGGHVGGVLCFGSDGRLYLGRGDGQVPETAQSLASWHGKILRYEPGSGAVPADNPFVNVPGAEPYTWSLGHRNVFGLAVHPPTGALLCTENGNFLSDELNTVRRGANYGWPIYEGREPAPDPVTEDPLETFYPEPSLTGAGFWTAEFAPAAARGDLFLGGFNRGEVFQVRLDPGGTRVVARSLFGRTSGPVIGIVEGPDGLLYLLYADTRMQGAERVGRLVHESHPLPSLHLSAVSNVAVGGSLTLGVVGQSGANALVWLGAQRFAQALPTPFGPLWVPADLVLPAQAVGGDGRAYFVVTPPELASLRGQVLHAQGGTVQGSTARLTNPSSLLLR